MKAVYIISVLLLLLIGCAPESHVVLMKEFSGDGVAVIDFSTQGNYLESAVGVSAADLLTEALFLKSYIRVIDRSKVNNLLLEMELKSPEVISKEEIQSLGKKLNANYLILGRIVQRGEKEFLDSKSSFELYVSFRIISTQDSNVIGMAAYNISYEEDLYSVIKRAMTELALKMEL